MKHTSKQYTQLQPEDRVTLASLQQQAYGVRAMARVLNRSPSTISRELQRNSREGQYGVYLVSYSVSSWPVATSAGQA